jgi:hypothetical protein
MAPEYKDNPAFQKATAAQLEKNFTILDRQENREARLLQAKMHNDQMKEINDAKKADASIKQQDKMAQAFGKDLDPYRMRSGEFGKIANRSIQADILTTLLTKPNSTELKNLSPIQMEELAIGVARMLSGSGGSSRAQVEHLVPGGLASGSAKITEWLTAEPTGTNQRKFVAMFADTINREKETAEKQMDDIRKKIINKHAVFVKKYPDAAEAQLRDYGLDLKGDRISSNVDDVNNEEKHPYNGKIAVFDKNTKKFLRYE